MNERINIKKINKLINNALLLVLDSLKGQGTLNILNYNVCEKRCSVSQTGLKKKITTSC